MEGLGSKIDGVLPKECHGPITSADQASSEIPVSNGWLVFPKDNPSQPLHLMGHQKGPGVVEATGAQLEALRRGSAKQAGELRITPEIFAGAILAGGRVIGDTGGVMGDSFGGKTYRDILEQYLAAGGFKGTEPAPAIAATLNLLDGPELLSLVGQVLSDHGDDLNQKHSEMRLWVLCACPYLAKLHNVYLSALLHGKSDEIAWTVGRLAALPGRISESGGDKKKALIAGANRFAQELDIIVEAGITKVIDPIGGTQVQLSKLANLLRSAR